VAASGLADSGIPVGFGGGAGCLRLGGVHLHGHLFSGGLGVGAPLAGSAARRSAEAARASAAAARCSAAARILTHDHRLGTES
jgi:hypothetical protein